MHFPTRAALVGALFDFNAESEGLQESLRRVWDAPDAVSALDAWAAHLADYHVRLLAIDRAVERVRHDDADAAALRRRVVAEKLQNPRRLARWLEQEGRLKAPWTTATATDMLFALISSDMIEALTVDRRWSHRRLAKHLSQLFRGRSSTARYESLLHGVPGQARRSPSRHVRSLTERDQVLEALRHRRSVPP